MSPESFKRKLMAILSADVKGYSRLMGENEGETVKTLTAYRKIMAELIQQYRGRVIDSPGDNILAEFGSVVDAVQCSVAAQNEFKARNAELPENRRMVFRMGVNLGDVIEEEGRIYGDGVHIAARLEALAEPGGICISKTAFDHIESKLPLGYQFLGEQKVKNIAKPVGAYKVLMEPRIIDGEEKGEVKTRRADKPPLPLPDKPSIAVLPFVNMSGDPAQDFISDGLTDYIITSLSVIPHVFVIASTSTFTYKGKPVKVQRVAEELGVQYVLEGSVQKAENRVRLSVQLVDAISGRHLWAESYDRSLDDLFALQDDVTMKVITSLQVKLAEGAYALAAGKSTKNLKALQCFWQGEYHYIRFTAEDNVLAGQYAEKALEMDPEFSTAWALLGWVLLIDVEFGVIKSPAESLKQAGECAQKAIALNDSCAKAYSLVGHLNLLQRKYDDAIKYGEKAVALNPNDPHMLCALAQPMNYNGNFDESIALVEKAMRLCPNYPTYFLTLLSQSCFMAGRYEEALAAGELLLSRSDKSERDARNAHMVLARAHAELGQIDQASLHIEEARKMNPKAITLGRSREYAMRFYRDPAHAERSIASLRKAGLK